MVAPHAGAWIETRQSRLLRRHARVAPHAGAWIETASTATQTAAPVGRAPCGRVDRNAAGTSLRRSRRWVAPHAGAWIETTARGIAPRIRRGRAPCGRVDRNGFHPRAPVRDLRSRPMRARGSKPIQYGRAALGAVVAPHAGAWIETGQYGHIGARTLGRAPCGRVDRNGNAGGWRGRRDGRAPCGRVDRNASVTARLTALEQVAPHAGAWIETLVSGAARPPRDFFVTGRHSAPDSTGRKG